MKTVLCICAIVVALSAAVVAWQAATTAAHLRTETSRARCVGEAWARSATPNDVALPAIRLDLEAFGRSSVSIARDAEGRRRAEAAERRVEAAVSACSE